MSFQEIVIEVDDTNHDDFIENGLAVLHFFSDCHMNCLMTLPLIEDIAQEFSEHEIVFGKINIDEVRELARKYKITCVPAVLFFREGEQVDRLEQIQEDLIREKISALLNLC